MKKILLIAVNARFSHPNLALRYLRNSVDGLEYDTSIREYTIRTRPDEIVRDLEEERPDVAAFSVYIWNTLIVRRVLELLPAGGPVVVLGGPEAGYDPGYWTARYPAVRFVVTGHGEEAFRRLASEGFAEGGSIVPSRNGHFSTIPFPYLEEDLAGFANRNVYYESGRGCPFSCSYCLSSRGDQAPEFKDAATVLDEIARIMAHRPRLVKFVDRTFNAPAQRAREIWAGLMGRYAESGTVFHFEVHPALLGDGDLDLLEGSPRGLFHFEMGVQSTHDAVLEASGRTGRWEAAERAIAALVARTGVRTHLDLIAGLPGEDPGMLALSFDRAYRLCTNHLQLGTLKLLPGTEMRERAADYGMRFNPEPPYEIAASRWLSAEDVALVKKIARLTDGLYNGGKFRLTLSELLPRCGSPWELYARIARLPGGVPDLSWERLHGLVSALAREFPPDDTLYLADCLAWDWYGSFATHRVPAFLKSEEVRRARRELKLRRGIIDPETGRKLTAEELRRARVFVPATREFMERHMGGKGMALFIEGRGPVCY